MSNWLVSEESIRRALANPNPEYVMHFVGRALVVLLDRQTREESAQNVTNVTNMRGFSQSDARTGSLTAKFYIKNKRLEPWMIAQWTKQWRGKPRLAKYWRQLNEAALAKQQKAS